MMPIGAVLGLYIFSPILKTVTRIGVMTPILQIKKLMSIHHNKHLLNHLGPHIFQQGLSSHQT